MRCAADERADALREVDLEKPGGLVSDALGIKGRAKEQRKGKAKKRDKVSTQPAGVKIAS